MSATTDPDNDAPKVYSSHLADLLKREYERMATLVARGEVIVRTVLSILTVLVAITALAMGASVGIKPHVATWIIMGAAALLGLGALLLGSLAQSAPSDILSTDETTLGHMVGSRWSAAPGDDPLRIVAIRTAEAIKSLRAANEVRARRAKKGLIVQFMFIACVLIAVATEVVLQRQ
jgi:hypothetical protein